MELGSLAPMALIAIFVAMLVTAFEMRAALVPPSCPECPHCQAAAAERERRDHELQAWYARQNGLDGKDDDDRIG